MDDGSATPGGRDGAPARRRIAASLLRGRSRLSGTSHDPLRLNSALDQSYPPFEVIVGCDKTAGPTEGHEVLQEFGDSIVTVRQPNRSEGAAKNAAVQLATGEYVVVLDADDVFLPRRLEALAWLATRRSHLDILTTDAIVKADGVPFRRAYHSG